MAEAESEFNAKISAQLRQGEHQLWLEVAFTPEQQARGLMWRQNLADNQGMLFPLDAKQPACFWMLNTPLPLSIAFFNQDWQLLEYLDMSPLSREIHCAQQPAHYAIEVNQGWFEQRQIQIGETWQLHWLSAEPDLD